LLLIGWVDRSLISNLFPFAMSVVAIGIRVGSGMGLLFNSIFRN